MIIAVSDPALPVLIGLLALCLALSAFFSGTETALMSFNRYQLRTMANQGHRGAILAERLLQRPDRLIGLILLGNNLANNLAATLVAIIVLRTYGEEWVAVGAGVLTLVMLIFCEVGPKTYAAIHPRRLATTSSYAYVGLQWLLRPAVYAINWITNGALRLVGLNVDRQTQQNTLSREELRTVVAEAGLMIPRSHQQMLIGILDLERITVNDIMIPRQDISGIDLDDDWERILDQLRQTPHTRLPVYRGDMGNMVGLLHMKRVAQELGGKSPNLIFADADLERALGNSIRRCFYNTGQSCNAPTRMLVERSVYEQAVQIVRRLAEATEVGDPRLPGKHIGPLSSRIQFERVQAYMQIGIDEGARLVTGGPGRAQGFERGYYVRPTVFADVHNQMRIAREEIFGPVLAMIPFDSLEEAIEIGNDTPYGLAAYLHTSDMSKAHAVARRLRAGSVHINGAGQGYAEPFGGFKQSGNGRECGAYGLLEFLELKSINGYYAA